MSGKFLRALSYVSLAGIITLTTIQAAFSAEQVMAERIRAATAAAMVAP